MRQGIFKLPSKAEIEFRQVMLAEENLLATSVKSKSGDVNKTLTEIMTKCTISVVNPGPYSFLEAGGKPKWDNMAKGDRFSAMMDLRCLSYKEGKIYEAELRCPSSACKHSFDWEVNLEEDLFRQDIPEETLEKIKDNIPLEVTIDGKIIKYSIALGKTEKTYETLSVQNPGRDMSCALRARIIEVEGLKAHEILDWLDGNNGDPECKFTGLTSEDCEELRDAFDRTDGGIDTTLEAECPKCHQVFEFDLPFAGIFLPGKGIIKRKKEARKEAMKKKEAEKQKATEESC